MTVMGSIEVRQDDGAIRVRFEAERRRALAGVEDDMWATFAEMAEPKGLVLDGEIIGACSIDEDNQLHAFHVSGDAEQAAGEVLAVLVERKGIEAIITSTLDPRFLSLGLDLAERTEPVALLYEHTARSTVTEVVDLRPATSADHRAAVDFYEAEIGPAEDFLDGFLAERIEKGELYLMDDEQGRIAAAGECRADPRSPGHAHLGLVVGSARRGRGVGGGVMHRLVQIAVGRGRSPLCSTEPTNLAARGLIHRVGFRTRHRVLRLTTKGPGSPAEA